MDKRQAASWVKQELGKITTVEQAQEHLTAYRVACDGFFKSQAGLASAARDPLARQARHDLAAKVAAQFKL